MGLIAIMRVLLFKENETQEVKMEGKNEKNYYCYQQYYQVGYMLHTIDHVQTYTPDYLANQAQTGMINEASTYYNPAGLGRLEQGKYFHVGFQFAHGHEKNVLR